MKKLIFKLIIFILPFLVISAFPLTVLIAAGELVPIKWIICGQSKKVEPSLVGFAYSNPWSYAKLRITQLKKPAVLVLGSSRVMAFRESFFKNSFYNAARGANSIEHFRQFMNQIPKEKSPKVLIAALDHIFFNPDWVYSTGEKMFAKPATGKDWMRIYANNWIEIYRDYREGKFSWDHLNQNKPANFKKVGLFAAVRDSGFMNDGSYLYQKYLEDLESGNLSAYKNKFKKALSDISNGKDQYAYGHSVSEEALSELRLFLSDCQKRKIHVVGYLPPFPPTIYQALLSKKSDYVHVFQLAERLEPIFKEFGYSFFDFTHPAVINLKDEIFFDDAHDTGQATRRIFLHMIRKDKKLSRFAAFHNILSYLREHDRRGEPMCSPSRADTRVCPYD